MPPSYLVAHTLPPLNTPLRYSDNSTMGWVMSQGGGCKGCTDKWVIHYTGGWVGGRGGSRGLRDSMCNSAVAPSYIMWQSESIGSWKAL